MQESMVSGELSSDRMLLEMLLQAPNLSNAAASTSPALTFCLAYALICLEAGHAQASVGGCGVNTWCWAGMLGIGGGFVISPLMLALGAHPSAAAATSNTILFFSSGLATLSFQREGLLNRQVSSQIIADGEFV